MKYAIRRIAAADVGLMRRMLDLLGEAFEDVETYSGDQPYTKLGVREDVLHFDIPVRN